MNLGAGKVAWSVRGLLVALPALLTQLDGTAQ